MEHVLLERRFGIRLDSSAQRNFHRVRAGCKSFCHHAFQCAQCRKPAFAMERGRFPVIKIYGPKLFKQACTKFSFEAFDAFVELITPAFVNMFGASFFIFILHAVAWQLGIDFVKYFTGWWFFVVILGFLHVLVGLIAARADRLLWKAVLYISAVCNLEDHALRKINTKETGSGMGSDHTGSHGQSI